MWQPLPQACLVLWGDGLASTTDLTRGISTPRSKEQAHTHRSCLTPSHLSPENQDCDDDGEDAAGGRLLHLLQLARAEDVVVVVSRWFGGVLLGPSRFGLISNCARELLVSTGFIAGAGEGGGGGGGGRKKGKGR
jgi:hypothetical protein